MIYLKFNIINIRSYANIKNRLCTNMEIDSSKIMSCKLDFISC